MLRPGAGLDCVQGVRAQCGFAFPAGLVSVPAVKNPIPLLRKLALIEGISFLLLLGVAMPLKYFADMPMAVKIAGWLHGILFTGFVLMLIQTMVIAGWSVARAAFFFVAALLPFGPFVVDGRMRQHEEEFDARAR